MKHDVKLKLGWALLGALIMAASAWVMGGGESLSSAKQRWDQGERERQWEQRPPDAEAKE